MFRTVRRGLICCSLGAAVALLPASLRADSGRDHDQARRAVEHGEVLSLFDIFARVRSDLNGEVVGVSFKQKHGRWVYEFKVIGAAGRLVEVDVDAASAEILKPEKH